MADKTTKRFQCPRHWTLAQRLDHYTDKSGGPDACWPWMGAGPADDGYGQLLWQRKPQRAHRLAWINANGPIQPDKPHILHKCDVRSCVNPDHLWAGTNAENNADMIAKGRAVYPHGKLTEADVRAIRAASGMQKDIAKRFGVDQANVSLIRSGKIWKHVL